MKGLKPKLKEILSKVSVFYGVKECEIKSRRKNNPDVVKARQVYCYLSRNMTDKSTIKIGQEIGRGHATVLHSVKKVNNFMDVYPDFKKEVFSFFPKPDLIKNSIVIEDINLLQLCKSYSKTILNT